MLVNCYTCNKRFNKRPTEIKKSKSGKHFCNHSCAAKENNKLRRGELHPNYKIGKHSYRERKLRNSNLVCEICNESHPCTLEVHHIDGDRSNNKLDNLELLCANCHLKKHCR